MKPEYKVIYNRCHSLLEAEQSIQQFRKELISIIEKSSFKKAMCDTSLSFFVTIVTNPEAELIEDAHEETDKIYLKSAPEFDGDSKLYALKLQCRNLSLPKSFESILIYIGTKAFTAEVPKREMNPGAATQEETVVFTATDPLYSFDDVILSPNVRHRLERASAIIKNRNLIFEKWGFKRIDRSMKSIIFFYGPAGTGKTITAHAVASYLGKKIMLSSYAQIESKYVGEGAKNLRSIFEAAKEQDAVLFFDEADSFLSNRISETRNGSDKHYNRMSNEMFQLLENYDGCVIFATNLVSDIDLAFKSRIVDSIRFPLPDFDGRVTLLKHMTPPGIQFNPELTDEDIKMLSEDIDGFSGRDMRKSVLLSLADASIAAAGSPDDFRFTIDVYRKGFMEVKEYKAEMDKESNGGELIDIAQAVIDKQVFSEKVLQIAQYVLFADGIIEPEEKMLIDELSNSFGIPTPDWEQTRSISLNDICKGLMTNDEKFKILSVACRMATSDGNIPECEMALIKEIYTLLGFDIEKFDDVKAFMQTLLDCNSTWESITTANVDAIVTK